MIYEDIHLVTALMDMRLEEAQRAAQRHILVHKLDGGFRTRVQRRLRRMLHGLGHGLVTVGRYLERGGLSEQSL